MLPLRQINYIYETLGQRIKTFRGNLGYNQKEFAELLKISRSSFVNIEKGRQRAPLHLIYEIARLLKVSINELLPSLSEDLDSNMDDRIEREIITKSAGDIDTQTKLLEFIRQQKSTKSK